MESNRNKSHGGGFYPQAEYSVDEILEELEFRKRSDSADRPGNVSAVRRLRPNDYGSDAGSPQAKDQKTSKTTQTDKKPAQNVPVKNVFIPASDKSPDQKTAKPAADKTQNAQGRQDSASLNSTLPRQKGVFSAAEIKQPPAYDKKPEKKGLNDAQEFFESLKKAAKSQDNEKAADVIYKRFEHPVSAGENTREKGQSPYTRRTMVIDQQALNKSSQKKTDEGTGFSPAAQTLLADEGELTGQVVMPGFEDCPDSAEDGKWEEKRNGGRGQGIKDFARREESEAAASEDEPEQLRDSLEIEDCETSDDIPVVRMDLIVRRRRIIRRLIMTSAVFFLLLLLAFSSQLKIDGISPVESPDVYLVANIGLLVLTAIINAGAVFGGFLSLLRLAPDLDSPVSIGMAAAVLQSLVMLFYRESCANVSLFGAAAVFAVIMGSAGKLFMVERISKNFEMIADSDEKFCCNVVDKGEEVFEMGRGLAVGEASVCYEKGTILPKNFLARSFAQDPVDVTAQRTSPYIILIGLIAAVLCFYFGKGESEGQIEYAVSALCAAVLMSLPFTSLIAGNLPLKLACKKLFNQGAMLSSYDAVERFSDVNVLALDAGQLFPEGTVQLINIKNAGNIAIDRVLLDAAGVAIATGGPLAPVFKSIIEGKTGMLPEVDTLIYEEKMGISGWVSGRRVLIGNRTLMDNHGIWIPDSDILRKFEQEGLHTVFLSNTGVLSAVFIIKYNVDGEIAAALQSAVTKGLALSVYSCDPNINEDMICGLFDLPKNCVRIMGAPARRAFKQAVSEKGREDAALVHCFDAGSMARGVSSCIRLKRKISGVGVLQVLMMILGLFLSIGMVLTMGITGFSIGLMLVWQLLCLALTLIFQAIL